jgi:hypothetical protein
MYHINELKTHLLLHNNFVETTSISISKKSLLHYHEIMINMSTIFFCPLQYLLFRCYLCVKAWYSMSWIQIWFLIEHYGVI